MRGVGASEPQLCPDFLQRAGPAFQRPTRKEWEDGYRAAVRECVASIDAQGYDRTAYGADVSAADAIVVGGKGSIVQRFLEDPMHAPDASCIAAIRTVQFKTRGFDPLLTLIITDTSKSRPARRLK
jgi:hypothetical protein